jgi:hypothetical protein
MHLHACTRILGIDLIGLIDNGDGRIDCVLRSPGLRPRHLATIIPALPNGKPTKGLDVVFPERFTITGEEVEVTGGTALDLKAMLQDQSLDEDAENWDALDQEEVEAMKQISSAHDVKSLNDVDIEHYPRFVVKDFGDGPKAVDRLLKVLLPTAKVVYDKQEADKESAKIAAELRDKREHLQKRKKANEAADQQRYFMKGYKQIEE